MSTPPKIAKDIRVDALATKMSAELRIIWAMRSQAPKADKLCMVDMDGTLMRGTLAVHFGKWLVQRGAISRWRFGKAALIWLGYRAGLVAFSTLIEHLVADCFGQKSQEWVLETTKAFIDQLPQRCYNARVVAFLRCIQPTALCILTSRSPDFLVAEIARKLAFDAWHASTCNLWNGNAFHLINGEEKGRLCIQVAKNLKIPRNAITALGNSEDDIPLLEAAGSGIAVHPNARLTAWAKRVGCEIWESSSSTPQ